MRLSSRTWFIISLVLLAAAMWTWKLGDEKLQRDKLSQPPATTPAANASTKPQSQARPSQPFGPLLTRVPAMAAHAPRLATASSPAVAPVAWHPDPRFPHRLQNTSRTLTDLSRDDHAVLLRNALLDTANGVPLELPAHLKSAEPGSYIVQAKGPVDQAFRARLDAAGATMVSYIPNNAYLVRMEEAQAAQFGADPQTQAVLAWEPYYKFDSALLPLAVARQPLPEGVELVLAVFPGTQAETRQQLNQLGAEVVREDRSPFGPLLTVKTPADSLIALGQMKGVHGIEQAQHRALMNDLSRVALSAAPDQVATTNYYGLTGSNIVVNVNDSGVDATHPDLAGRVLTARPAAADDPDGHGTHVAGTIASSGEHSNTVTNAPGSPTNATYRGMAPAAKIFPLRIFLGVGPEIGDAFVQETTAASNYMVFGRTNPIVSNNSWGYPRDNTYNFATASYDAAVRDALPNVSGAQPIAYVFAAGNSGAGLDNGQGGLADSVTAPGTGKNVITVAASENNRGITNEMWAGYTDSSDQIASFSSRGNVGIGVEGENGRFKPDITAPGTFVVSTRATGWLGLYGNDLDLLNDDLGPYYRYESGTSMATPNITGLLALIQDYFENVLHRSYSPALLKAVLINGARSVGPEYELSPQTYPNYQGWGLANLTNSLPIAVTNAATEKEWPIRYIDQSPTNALATGESRSWRISLTPAAANKPLRLTLVWTDPPGNPAASLKLVNDLDLVLTNLDTGEVFLGNNIPVGSDFNQASPTNSVSGDTNAPVLGDNINNVENIFLREAGGTNFVVTVVARRVNVNAVTSNTSGIVQDFALVFSSANVDGVNGLTEVKYDPLLSTAYQPPALVTFTNGWPLFNQRVGANFPLSSSTNGQRAQWVFYRFDNSLPPSELTGMTNGSNVAFITFVPPNLSKPRNGEADIDLYVSKDPAITNLDETALRNAFKSLNQGGTELVFFTNGTLSDVYYVGVKSEDQMASEYSIVGLSTDEPFEQTDPFGNKILTGFPVSLRIPDGSAELPGRAYQFGIPISSYVIKKTIVTNIIFHESVGDLYGHLSHGTPFAVLNNHRVGNNSTNLLHPFIYDDSDSGEILGATRTDGPGSLYSFFGQQAMGLPFILAQADNALNHTGRVQLLRIKVEPRKDDLLGHDFNILPGQFDRDVLEIPADVSKLHVIVGNLSGPVNLYVRKDSPPDDVLYDKAALINAPGGELTIGWDDVPPLTPGIWHIAVYNPGAVPVTGHLSYKFDRSLPTALMQTFTSSGGPWPITDDAESSIYSMRITNARPVAGVAVGVRIDHPRAADLAVRLVSPLGQKVLLVENRGGDSTNGFGQGYLTNLIYTGFTDDTNLSTGPIKFARPPYSDDAIPITNVLGGFEGVITTNYHIGMTFEDWLVVTNPPAGDAGTNVAIVVGSPSHSGANVLALLQGRVERVLPTVAGRQYVLRFYYASTNSLPTTSDLVLRDSAASVLTNLTFGLPDSNWQEMQVPLAPQVSGTTLQIGWNSGNGSMVLDDFELVELGNTKYYTPEEPLAPLVGTPGVGTWSLEIVDSRVGPEGASPQLIDWQLNFVFAPTNPPAIHLTNDVVYSGSISNADIHYFYIDVPRSATLAGNFLTPVTGGDLYLLYNEAGLPTGSKAGDVTTVSGGLGNPATLILNTNSPPLLRPGQRYYLGVTQVDTNLISDYTLRVVFDRSDTNLPSVPTLISGVPVHANIAVTNLLDYYQFDVTGSDSDVLFELTSTNADLTLLVRKWSNAANPLPTPTRYDYISQNAGTNSETIEVTTNSTPVALSPGTWYVAVQNVDAVPGSYTLTATSLHGGTSVVVPLAYSTPLTYTNAVADQLTTIFQLALDASYPGVRIEMSNLDGPATLYVDRDQFPRPNSRLAEISGLPNQTATMVLTTNLSLPVLSGNLNLIVQSPLGTNVQFTLLLTAITNTSPKVIDLVSGNDVVGTVAYNPFEPTIDYYRISASNQVRWVDVELTPLNGNVDLLVSHDTAPTLLLFDYASVNLALTNDSVHITRLSAPVPAQDGDWIIGVVNQDQTSLGYVLKATVGDGNSIMVLTNGSVIAESGFAHGTDYYRIPVSPSATLATIRLDVFGGSVAQDLGVYFKKGLPLPSEQDFHYQPFAFGQTQLLQIDTNSVPVPLSAANWFLAVTNLADFVVDYRLSYVEMTNDLALANQYVSSVVYQTLFNTVVGWYAQNGQDYYVEGSTNSANGPWTKVSDVITASGAQGFAYLPIDTPYQYFRVVKGSSPLVQISLPVVLPDGSVRLTWTSQDGTSYDIQVSTDLIGWSTVKTQVANGASSTVTLPPSGLDHAFYRIRITP